MAAFDGDGKSGLWLWGAQFEAAEVPGRYLKTVQQSDTSKLDASVAPKHLD
jgi:hypothetical protein